jgi:hypothetical protein
MRFHEYKTLWEEMRGKLPREVTVETFCAASAAGGARTGNGLVLAEGLWQQLRRPYHQVCLLADDPEVITPDVLADDRDKYEASGDRKYVEKARRRGKLGWNVGAKIEVMPHYRRPHPALVWTGHGRALPRIAEQFHRIAGQAIEHLDHPDCETACYRCLKSYYNQRYHQDLKWPQVMPALEELSGAAPQHRPRETGDIDGSGLDGGQFCGTRGPCRAHSDGGEWGPVRRRQQESSRSGIEVINLDQEGVSRNRRESWPLLACSCHSKGKARTTPDST